MIRKLLMAACVLLTACGDVFFAEPAPPVSEVAFSIVVPNGEVYDKANRIAIRASLDAVFDTFPGGSTSTTFGPITLDTVVPFSPSAETRVRLPIHASGVHNSLVAVFLMRDADTLFFSFEATQITAGETNQVEFEFLSPYITSITMAAPARTLTGPGDTLTLVAVPRFATGDVLSDFRGCGYISLTPSVAAVGQNNGRVVAVANGSAQIMFSCNSGRSATVTVNVGATPQNIAGAWSGTYAWNCSAQNSGSSPITFNVPTGNTATLSGTATILGSTGPMTLRRYSSATFGTFGDIVSGTLSPTGHIIEIHVPSFANVTSNIFTGTLQGTRLTGTTLNGQGCSANAGPAGTFDVTLGSATGGNASLTGTVVNATNSTPVSGATVTLTPSGGQARSTATASNGTYSIANLTAGTHTVTVTAPGFSNFSSSINIAAGAQTRVFALSPGAAAGQWRVILTWGAQPPDLDSHMFITGDSSRTAHISFMNPGTASAYPNTTLDTDETDGHGPETITITQVRAGALYKYSVNNFSESGSFQTSQARVDVYNGSNLVATFTPPASGTGVWWNVFTMQNNALTPVNTITSGPPSFQAEGAGRIVIPRIK